MSKFTDRFIKVPCREYDIKHKELTGEEYLEDTYEKINPFEISSYRPSYSAEERDIERTNVYFKSGESTLVFLSVQQFELLLNNHIQ